MSRSARPTPANPVTTLDAGRLRWDAEAATTGLPPLLAEALRLAATVRLGEHGRRRSGVGTEFWQYRPAQAGDAARAIDWRRSARSDAQFVREREWQAAQSVWLWADAGRSMQFASRPSVPTKAHRAAVLALAAAVLLCRAGERVGLLRPRVPLHSGEAQLGRLAEGFETANDPAEYALPEVGELASDCRALFVSDFLAAPEVLSARLELAATRKVKGALLMVLDPQEEAFPFDGRTIFESVGGSLQFETQRARDLRARYQQRLTARKDRLAQLAVQCGWQFSVHHTDQPAALALLWVHGALGGRA